MLSLFDLQKSYLFNNKFVRIFVFLVQVVFSLSTNLLSDSRKIYASGNNKNDNRPRKPAVLDVDSVTVFWIVAAFLFVPLILTGLFSH